MITADELHVIAHFGLRDTVSKVVDAAYDYQVKERSYRRSRDDVEKAQEALIALEGLLDSVPTHMAKAVADELPAAERRASTALDNLCTSSKKLSSAAGGAWDTIISALEQYGWSADRADIRSYLEGEVPA